MIVSNKDKDYLIKTIRKYRSIRFGYVIIINYPDIKNMINSYNTFTKIPNLKGTFLLGVLKYFKNKDIELAEKAFNENIQKNINKFSDFYIQNNISKMIKYIPKPKPVCFINKFNNAYIWFPDLGEDSSENRSYIYQMHNLIAKIDEEDFKEWVIDLRFNNGGVIEYYLLMICQFIDSFNIKTRNKYGNIDDQFRANGRYFKFFDKKNNSLIYKVYYPVHKLVKNRKINVLINTQTASSAEIISILFKKYRNATLYGKVTNGICSIVTVQNFKNISFHFPTGLFDFDQRNEFEKIIPDIEEIPDEYLPHLYKFTDF